MKNSISAAEDVRRRAAAHKARQRAAGRVAVSTFLSAETVQQLDRIKEERGASSRAPLIEEAVRFYIENMRA
ncbi:ribbon-helix-helix protein, CopG family [Rhizobium sp. CFBP 8762]|uniref:ribbon-helix-helix protein, CopG family n=1 Tax=Rhizobium sp. CFBP 8762 TaxID=2775279 RepID=UPI00177F4C09|nr:ribbon-helix-helix protein, CopG family [Rhizobium sp. CFBP 8762]MBD8555163.1 ribbon-helix-helix protein, CopG family [Rhizobium sp. CFBP 8762]